MGELPPASGTLAANLFSALCAQLRVGREGSIGDRDAWESAGYPKQYPNAVFSPDQLRSTVNNLRVTLRKLHTTKKTKYLWVVERVKGAEEGFRLRVLDPDRCRAFGEDWRLRHYDPEVWATKHTIQFLDEPGVRPPGPLRRVTAFSLAGLVLAATGWAGLAGARMWRESVDQRQMRARRDSLTAGAYISEVLCTSRRINEYAESPDDRWNRCEHAADGGLVGAMVWSSAEDKSSTGEEFQEWIQVTLREPADVDKVRLHWRAQPDMCVRDDRAAGKCRAPGQPELLMVEGRLDGKEWKVLLDEVQCPGMAPWEPMDLEFAPVRVRHIRVTAQDKQRDGSQAATFQLAEIVINPIPLEDYPSELPTPGMFASAGG